MATDPFAELKAKQRESWALFAPIEQMTTPVSGHLVRFAGVRSGMKVLDVACGTGVAAITAARAGATVTGLDFAPELLARAKENAAIAEADAVTWKEGDAENLPFRDGEFDVVLSQFGHMFAPRAQVTADELLRVCKPGGTVAFSTWPPQFMTGRVFALVGSYLPPPPPAAKPDPPPQWGDTTVIRERLGPRVRDLVHDTGTMRWPALSPQHYRQAMESTSGPILQIRKNLANDAKKYQELQRGIEALASTYFTDNVVRMDYLLTRATKI
ncbi:MAG TPA: class I SAM-dependent methyltransferase [Candidatus Thermoplasmatota archaeon]|nr:class I SAM-dependent methyltransferase [Candidatus Thermoplasmatota archaeon]